MCAVLCEADQAFSSAGGGKSAAMTNAVAYRKTFFQTYSSFPDFGVQQKCHQPKANKMFDGFRIVLLRAFVGSGG